METSLCEPSCVVVEIPQLGWGAHLPGRPCFLNEEQKRKVITVVSEKTPEDVGFPAHINWTCSLVAAWIEKELSIVYSERGILDVLHNLGFSCTRPTYTLKKADSEKQEEFKKTFQTVKNRLLHEDIDCILFQDEAMIRDYQEIERTWFLKGQQRIIPTYGKHQSVK